MLNKSVYLAFVGALFVLSCYTVSSSNAAIITSPFRYTFNTNGILYEAGNFQESSSPYWWLNSGAKLNISGGRGRTVQKELNSYEKWRLLYAYSNPLDTDNGYHPQNIFRLITRSKWKNTQEIVYFRVLRNQFSASPNRDASNGLLLMSRYQNQNTLYYAGVRVDGNAVIKKKLNGKYYTLASKKIFPGTYDRKSNPSLLPKYDWIGLKTLVNNTGGIVNIKLYMDRGWTGKWTLIAEANDDGRYGNPILNEGYSGIRTDFMDVEFENFWLINI